MEFFRTTTLGGLFVVVPGLLLCLFITEALEQTINVEAFMKMREKLRGIAQKIYDNTQTEVILERA